MHVPDWEQRASAVNVAEWAMDRLADRRTTRTTDAVNNLPLPAIGPDGIGTSEAWTVLRDRVLASALATDDPRYLAFVGGATSVAAALADMAVSAAGVYAGSELEGAEVVTAERAAIRWLADLMGLPEGSHGTFVSGGSMANLSALVVARNEAANRTGRTPRLIIAGGSGHSSIAAAGMVMGCGVVRVGCPDSPMDAASLRAAIRRIRPHDIAAVVATAGATNTGAVDDLAGIAAVCAELGIWLHVDAAYGGAALLADRTRDKFRGIEAADSVTIDPHKWLFTPFDCGAVIYRDPSAARKALAQTAVYLDPVNGEEHDNPADYALHLSRRARGLPLWMSLVAHGTDAYRKVIDDCLDLADYARRRIDAESTLELAVEPSLSVLVFRRHGWKADDYRRWSDAARRAGIGLVTPTKVKGEPALRLCFVNPQTTLQDIDLILDDVTAPAIDRPNCANAPRSSADGGVLTAVGKATVECGPMQS